MIIGVTGKSGVGKSYFCEKMESANPNRFVHVNIDEIGHKVVEHPFVKGKIVDIFGKDCVKGKSLGDMVFNNLNLYKALADITWPPMAHYIDGVLSVCEKKGIDVILDWILLPKTYYWNMCNVKYLITMDEDRRKTSVMSRDNISEAYLESRDRNGMEYDESQMDYIIWRCCK